MTKLAVYRYIITYKSVYAVYASFNRNVNSPLEWRVCVCACVCVYVCVCMCKYETRENCTHAEHTVHVRFDTDECEKRFAASKRDERDGDNEDTMCFTAEETAGRDRK